MDRGEVPRDIEVKEATFSQSTRRRMIPPPKTGTAERNHAERRNTHNKR